MYQLVSCPAALLAVRPFISLTAKLEILDSCFLRFLDSLACESAQVMRHKWVPAGVSRKKFPSEKSSKSNLFLLWVSNANVSSRSHLSFCLEARKTGGKLTRIPDVGGLLRSTGAIHLLTCYVKKQPPPCPNHF